MNIFIDFLKGLLKIDVEDRFDVNQALNHPFIKESNLIDSENLDNNNMIKS